MPFQPIDMENHIKKAWQFYKSLDSPKYICAPMVEHSELAFRLLCNKYNTDLCYTPMLHSKMMVTNKTYKQQNFWTSPDEKKVFAQLCGNDPDIVLQAGQMVEAEVSAIDLNLGCPQGIAKKGHYGSYLLTETDLVCDIINKLYWGLKIPVTVKIRILDNEEDTLKLVQRIQEAGAYILTVHGRTKEMKKDLVGKCNWDMIKKIKETLKIPIFANGGIFNLEDVENCLAYTGCDGVMSSEALLENPSLFCKQNQDIDVLALEYIEFSRKYNPNDKFIKPHLYKMLYQGFKENTDLRDRFGPCKEVEEIKQIVLELQERRQKVDKNDKLGWYFRYWKKDQQNQQITLNNQEIQLKQENEQNNHSQVYEQQVEKKICLTS